MPMMKLGKISNLCLVNTILFDPTSWKISCIYYLSKFKTPILLCIECNLYMKEDICIYDILSNLGSAYSVFVSTFYATR
jgi:hypothetical protein